MSKGFFLLEKSELETELTAQQKWALEFAGAETQEQMERAVTRSIKKIKTEQDKKDVLRTIDTILRHSAGSGKISYVDVLVFIFVGYLGPLIKLIIGACNGDRVNFNKRMRSLRQVVVNKKIKKK